MLHGSKSHDLGAKCLVRLDLPPAFSSSRKHDNAVAVDRDEVWASELGFILLGRDRRLCARVPYLFPETIGGETTIADNPERIVRQGFDHPWRERQFVSLPRREDEADGVAFCIDGDDSLGSITATRSTKRFTMVSLHAVEPFFSAPAAL